MADFLIFQLYGAMASWGDIAVGEYRPSLGHPTKSAVIGLVAAALGIDRSEDEKHRTLSQGLGVGVCVRASGELMRDYHTVQVPGGKRNYATRRDELGFDKLNLNTILSQRDYRTDAYYQVAVWANGLDLAWSLAEMQASLKEPVYPLYLGRKSCAVSLPLEPLIFSNTTLKQAFGDYPCDLESMCLPYLSEPELISYYWEALPEEITGMAATMSYPRRDQVHSRKRWQFSNRDEFYYAEPVTGGA